MNPKNNGPRTDPCGTPEGRIFHVDNPLFNKTHCLRLDRYDLINFRRNPDIPILFLIYKCDHSAKLECFTKITTTVRISLLLSNACEMRFFK